MKVDVKLSIGYPTAVREDTLDLDDDLTDTEIDYAVEDWAANFIDRSWERVTEDEDDSK